MQIYTKIRIYYSKKKRKKNPAKIIWACMIDKTYKFKKKTINK